MGFFSEIDLEIREMIADGATRKQVRDAFPMLREDEIEMYFGYTSDADSVCPYCGGDCPSDHEYACDGYLGDVDDLVASMDGDFDSAMASAGFGTDEDYGYYGET